MKKFILPWVSALLLVVGSAFAADGPRQLCGYLTIASTTIGWNPDHCDAVELYTGLGDQWQTFRSPAVSASLTVSNSTRYDIFLYRSGNQIAVQKGQPWASGSSRGVGPGSAEIVRQNGAYVNAQDIPNLCAAKLCRYAGTINVDGGGVIAISHADLKNTGIDGIFTGRRGVSFPDADSTAVVPGSATSQQFVTHIDANGVQQKAQPQNVTGNAATATALAANGGNCSAGNAPLGVDASGAAEGCFDVVVPSELGDYVKAPAPYGSDNLLIMSQGGGRDTEASGISVGAGNSLTVPGGLILGSGVNSCDGSAGCVGLPQGTAPSAIGSNEIQDIAPTSVTSYRRTRAGASCAGFLRWTESTVNGVPVVTESCSAVATGDIETNAVTSAKIAVANNRRVCTMVIGADNGSALADADLAQNDQCIVPAAATVQEVFVKADGGTPSVIVRKTSVANSHTALLSSALATASSGARACSKTSAVTGIDGSTTCSATLQNNTLAAGETIGLASGTAGGVAKKIIVSVVYTID